MVDVLKAQLKRPWLAHAIRAYQQLNATNGALLAAALTFFSFLAIIPMLLLAVSVTGYVLRSNPDLQRQLFDKIASGAPTDLGKTMRGVVNTAIDNRTGLGLVALAGVALTGLGWINNLRLATEQVWEHSPPKRSFLKAKIADAGILAGLGVGLILSVGLTAVGSALQSTVVDRLSLDGRPGIGLATTVFTIGVAVLADTLIFLFLVIRLPRSEVPRGVAVRGAVLAAVGFEILKVAGTYYIARVTRSPSAAAFGTIIGVLVWLNLVFRFLLYCTAWTASATPDDLASHSDPRGHLDPAVTVVAGPDGLRTVATARPRRPSRALAVALMLLARLRRRP